MNNRLLRTTGLACAAAFIAFRSAAGPLTPPAGPIAPTNKTLEEVEPRTAVNATNTPGDASSLFVIDQPGSYYLTGDITGVAGKSGIQITTSGVTLDLNGFDLVGVPGSISGVGVISGSNIEIRNGSVRDWGSVGVHAGPAFGSALRRLRVSGNQSIGLFIGIGGVVEGCTAKANGADGIFADTGAIVRENTAESNLGSGIYANFGATIIGNSTVFNAENGIRAGDASTITQNSVYGNTLNGILALSGATVSDCTADANNEHGIVVGAGSTLSDSRATGNGDAGIVAFNSSAEINTCSAVGNGGIGIHAGSGSQVTGCVANENGANGIQLEDNSKAVDCTSQGNAFDGVHCFAGATVEGCLLVGNQRDGVRATNDRVTIRDSIAHSNVSVGFNVVGAGCFVARNHSTANGANFNLAGASLFGPIVNAATMATNTNPSANYDGS